MASIWDSTKIQAARKSAGLSAETAAETLNVTPEYISMLENGHRQPSQKLIARMSVLYRVPIGEFLRAEKNFAVA